MNNSVALLYNFNEEKLKMIKMVCMMMQVRFKEVARAEYEQPLGALLGISGIENHGEVYQGEEFQEEILLPDKLLRDFLFQKFPIKLPAAAHTLLLQPL